MKRFPSLLLVAVVLFLTASLSRADEPSPKFFTPAQEARVVKIEARLAAIEAALAIPAPPAQAMPRKATTGQPALNAVGAVIELAPAGKVWTKAGTAESDAPWELRDEAVVTAAPVAFPTPVRNVLYRTLNGGSPCANGRCPK